MNRIYADSTGSIEEVASARNPFRSASFRPPGGDSPGVIKCDAVERHFELVKDAPLNGSGRQSLLVEWESGERTGLRPARAQALGNDLMRHTGIWLP